MTRIRRMLSLFRERIASEQGSVAVLIALAIFLVCGMLMMTWNTAQLSKEKMRLQNAADAAALEYCVWQARGMNAIQNINDEAWVVFDTGKKLLNYTVKVERWLTKIPFPLLQTISEGLLCAVPGALSGLMTNFCGSMVLPWTAKFYYYGSCALGIVGAQQLAAENGASGIGGEWLEVGDWKFGIYAVGCSMRLGDFFKLPLQLEKSPGEPFVRDEGPDPVLKLSKMWSLYSFVGTGNKWEFYPYVSKPSKSEEKREDEDAAPTAGDDDDEDAAPTAGDDEDAAPTAGAGDKKENAGDKETGKDNEEDEEDDSKKDLGPLPSPVVWLALKYKNEIRTVSLETWAGEEADSGMHKAPMIAIAAARCITGDVIVHNKEPEDDGSFKATNNRPVGFGAGATAKLVPVSEALKEIKLVGKTLGKGLGLVIYH